MNSFLDFCKYKYYSQFDDYELLDTIREKIDKDIDRITHENLYILNKIITSNPCLYWDKNVCNQVYKKLEMLFNEYRDKLNVDEEIFKYFLMGYNSYLQISEVISDLSRFNIEQEIKTRLYRLPTYTSIIESCISNFFRVIVRLIGQALNKDYKTQNTLGALISVMESNGYSEVTNKINVNLRNAINHGKVEIKKAEACDKLCFYYFEKREAKSIELLLYEFDNIIDATFDTASGLLLGLVLFINNHIELLDIDINKNRYIDFSLLAMQLSIPGVYCKSISEYGDGEQLNVEVEIKNTERNNIVINSLYMSMLVFDKYKKYNNYMFSFSNPRMLNGWIRYTNEELNDMYIGGKLVDTTIQSVIKRNDLVIFDASEENVDLSEVKYFCFPNHVTDKYTINNIQNASTVNRKRLRANLFIGNIKSKEDILDIINDGIDWLRNVKSPALAEMKVKHGSMEADALYIFVYKEDMRKSKNISTNNENFVCMVDYNLDGKTTLKNGGLLQNIWNKLYHEKIGNIQISWREKCYFEKRQKVGRNDLCPCGSGKKYKKCCGK